MALNKCTKQGQRQPTSSPLSNSYCINALDEIMNYDLINYKTCLSENKHYIKREILEHPVYLRCLVRVFVVGLICNHNPVSTSWRELPDTLTSLCGLDD